MLKKNEDEGKISICFKEMDIINNNEYTKNIIKKKKKYYLEWIWTSLRKHLKKQHGVTKLKIKKDNIK